MSFDQSHLDRKYFIDTKKYNCPFCNRKSITYNVIGNFYFNWSQEKEVYGYLVQCGGDTCKKRSMHLSDYYIAPKEYSPTTFSVSRIEAEDRTPSILDENQDIILDNLFFYHQPTTFFTLDSRINQKLRRLMSEAEGCAKMGYLVGASGCLRKVIYELLEIENVPITDDQGNKQDYSERIKTLKIKYPMVPPEYFDAMSNIQGMTSEQLHEGDWKPWTQSEFTFLVEVVKEVLTEVYVRPQEKSSVLSKILGLKPQKETKTEQQEQNNEILE